MSVISGEKRNVIATSTKMASARKPSVMATTPKTKVATG
jgi:hypothetical protein